MTAMCSCDEGLPAIHQSIKRKARKCHVCAECRRKIEQGETYVVEDTLWEGSWYHGKMCEECHCDVRELQKAGCCVSQGELRTCLREEMEWCEEKEAGELMARYEKLLERSFAGR